MVYDLHERVEKKVSERADRKHVDSKKVHTMASLLAIWILGETSEFNQQKDGDKYLEL